jgi:hypothetical protein
MVSNVADSFERREPADPWSGRQPRFEGLVSERPDRFFLLARLPSGKPVRMQLRQVSASELLRHFVVTDPY